MTAEAQKRAAARAAVDLVTDGMTVGLGTGSTAAHLLELLAARLAAGELRGVRGVPTSLATEEAARRLGIPLTELSERGVDLAIDGCDEVDDAVRAIKGLGGALAREKIVAASARSFVLIADASKRVARLTERVPVPVEVLPFGWRRTRAVLAQLGCEPALRVAGGEPVRTDNGNYLLDCRCEPHLDLASWALEVAAVPGVVEHGLFLHEAERALIAGPGGELVVLERGA